MNPACGCPEGSSDRADPCPENTCDNCGERFHRRRFNGRLEDLSRFRDRRFCGEECMAEAYQKEDPTRDAYRKRAYEHKGDECEFCGTTDNLTIHHRDGDWRNNAPENLQTLCKRCHTMLHHLRDDINLPTPERLEA